METLITLIFVIFWAGGFLMTVYHPIIGMISMLSAPIVLFGMLYFIFIVRPRPRNRNAGFTLCDFLFIIAIMALAYVAITNFVGPIF